MNRNAPITNLFETPVKSGPGFETQSGKVYRFLRDRILSGAYKPGDRLVRRTLGKQFDTSPIAVAEALWKLESDGLVESEAMHGSRVKTFTLEQVRGELLLREALETEVARLCAKRHELLPIEHLRSQAEKIDKIMSVPRDEYNREDMEVHCNFHRELARHCDAEPIARELERIWFQHIMVFNWINSAIFPVPADWHQRLVQAIASGDPDHADAMMRKHIEFGCDHQENVLRRINEDISK